MSQNKLKHSLALCLTVILMLLLISVLPEISIGRFKVKQIDLLAGIRQQGFKNLITERDSVMNLKAANLEYDSVLQTVKSGCPGAWPCIEDYSADSSALDRFFYALSQITSTKKSLRIAMYGDSFIEGDVFCGSIRDTLQTLFGGRGVGFVPITSEVIGFRNTIRHSFSNWKTYSLLDKIDTTHAIDIGPGGYSFIPEINNRLHYKPSKQRYLREFANLKLYYKNPRHAALHYFINDTLAHKTVLKRSDQIREWVYTGSNIKDVQFEFTNHEDLQVYGASFENSTGIYIDNFSMRGNSGIQLNNISDKMLKEFNYYRDYKLILLQFGLNVIRDDSVSYNWYVSRMIRVIQKLKAAFPRASILMLSVSDRSKNVDGEFKTISAVPAIRNAQRLIAKKTGIAFWDLYEAMGGEDSMVRFVKANPALAAKDYTHLNFKGGKKLAHRFVNSILYEFKQYESKAILQ